MEVNVMKAEKWGKVFDLVPREEDGYFNHARWTRVVAAALRAAASTEVLCPASADSSVSVTFQDNSKLYIGNPGQAYFPGFTIY